MLAVCRGGNRLLVLSSMSFRRRAVLSQIRWEQVLKELLHVSDMPVSAQYLFSVIIKAFKSTLHTELSVLHVVIS